MDEVNSMDLSLQAKILKAIEEKRFRPVGGEQDVHSDVRIVSAMNVDPITAVREGLLRRDLFYRLGVVQLALPPLRKRPEDIPLLTDFYVEQYNRNMERAISGVSELVRNALLAYDWPGNVRELRNAVESAFNLCTGATVQLNDIPRYIFYHEEEAGERQEPWPMPEHMGLQEAVRRSEKGLIVRALEQSRTVTEAAEKLRLTRQALQYKMMKYHLNG